MELSRACSGNELAATSDGLDSLDSELRELFGADKARSVGKFSLSENLEIALYETRP